MHVVHEQEGSTMKTWSIGGAVLVLALGAVITLDQMGMLRERPAAGPSPGGEAGPPTPEPDPEPSGGKAEVPPADADDAPADAGARLLRPPTTTCTRAETPITLGHPGVVDQAGIALALARPADGGATVAATGRIAFPTDRHASLASRAPGIVVRVAVDLGQAVAAGEELVRIDSAELGTAVAALRRALARRELWRQNVDRQRQLRDDGIGRAAELAEARSRLRESEAALAAARQGLRNLGLGQEEVAAAESDGTADDALVLRAPFAGTVTAVDAAPGEHCERGQVLVTVADTSRVWALLDVPERDLHHVRLGAQVAVRPEAARGDPADGAITWIAPSVDARTRTVPVRVELDNRDGAFRAGQFVVAAIPRGGDEAAVLVPRAAVQWDGCCNVVFVPGASEREFRTRKVLVGHRRGELVAIAEGLAPGERVVTEGSWLLKTEILKGSIGAGCCEVK